MTEPSKPKKYRPFFVIWPKVAGEGYCCLYGYLSLCRARGETKRSMAAWLKIPYETVKYNFRLLRKAQHKCQRYSDCLQPIILDLQRNIKPPDIGK